MVRNTDTSPSDSAASGILVETVLSNDDDEDAAVDEQMSEASSVGSVDGDRVPVGDLVDLTQEISLVLWSFAERRAIVKCLFAG